MSPRTLSELAERACTRVRIDGEHSMDLEHGQSLDYSTRKAVAPSARPEPSAERIARHAERALKVSEWLRREGYRVISIYVTMGECPIVQIASPVDADELVCSARLAPSAPGSDGRLRYYEALRHGVRIVWVL